jgi:hypothetical protein
MVQVLLRSIEVRAVPVLSCSTWFGLGVGVRVGVGVGVGLGHESAG